MEKSALKTTLFNQLEAGGPEKTEAKKAAWAQDIAQTIKVRNGLRK
jgi:hypothetical protein